MAEGKLVQTGPKTNQREGLRKLDRHPKKKQIISDLIAQKPYRDLASKYDVSKTTLMQWAKEQLCKSLVEDQMLGFTAREQLEWMNGELQKIMRACKRELRNPDDPTDYDFAPTPAECTIQYIRVQDDRNQMRKETLEDLNLRLENNGVIPLRIYVTKTDTRRILLEALKLCQNNIETIAKITGELNEITVNQQMNVAIDMSGVIVPKIMEAIRDATEDAPEVGIRITDAIAEIVDNESS